MICLLPTGAAQTALPPTLVVDGYVVAARTGGKWSPVQPGSGGWKNRPAASFREIGLGPVGGALRARFDEEEVPRGVYLRRSGLEPIGIQVGGVTPRTPRSIERFGVYSPVYVRALRQFLEANGLKRAQPRITRMARADLDGDGTKEILIEARNRDDLDSRGLTVGFGPNDYSVILLRAVGERGVVQIPLGFASARNRGSDLVRRLRAIADLDGDGRMEVVTSYTAWESFGGALWSYRTGKATKLVESGSGV